MIRVALLALIIAATAATAIASVNANVATPKNKSIFTVTRLLIVHQCAVDDCSDTPTS
jgi:hypothetical protein